VITTTTDSEDLLDGEEEEISYEGYLGFGDEGRKHGWLVWLPIKVRIHLNL